MTPLDTLAEEAMQLSERYGVFPTSRGGKHPSKSIPKNGDGSYRHNNSRTAPTGAHEAGELFARRDVGGIGLWCGGPGSVYCLDFDEAAYLAYWQEECRERGLKTVLARLVTVETPGGFHAWAQVPDYLETGTVLAFRPGTEHDANRGKESNIRIETRGVGQYAIVPPTPRYTYLLGHLLDIEPITAEEWGRLTDAARVFCEDPKGGHG